MALSKETEYGKITVSNELFKDTILSALTYPGVKDRIWLANKPSVEAEYDEEGRKNLQDPIRQYRQADSTKKRETSFSDKSKRCRG